MTVNTVRMMSHHYSKLSSYLLAEEREAAAFLIAGFFRNSTGVHFTVRDIMLPEEKDYDHRSDYHIQVSPLFFNKAISRAEANDITVIACHSHPFSISTLSYSPSDNHGESISSKTVRNCLNERPMGSMLFGPDKVVGRAWLGSGKPVSIDQLRIVDRHMVWHDLTNSKSNGRFNKI